MIDINDMEQHQQQEHTNKQCQLCQGSFLPEEFEKHAQVCPRKPVCCQFCQNNYAFAQIIKHKQSCGSRTKSCSICLRPVMIRQFPGHQQRCQTRRTQERRQLQERRHHHDVSEDIANRHHRNQQNQNRHETQQVSLPRERQNSQNIRERRKSSANKQVIIPKNMNIKPSHMIGPQIIKPMIDPVPISIRMAMKNKEQPRVPLQSKN